MHLRYLLYTTLLFTAFTFHSCRKKKDTIAVVKVYDINNQAVFGARVILDGGSNISKDTAFTNAAGEAYFNFNKEYQLGQYGVGIYEIKASLNTSYGSGQIKIEQESTSSETVHLQ